MIQQRKGRARRSSRGAAAAGTPSLSGDRSWRLAAVLLLVAAASALGNLVSLAVVAAAMGQTDSPQGPQTFLPVFAGALIAMVGDLVLIRGALSAIRPGWRFAGGRGLVMVGLVLQLPAAVAAGTLEALWPITVAYLLVLAALATLWLRSAPGVSAKPLARHAEEPLRRRAQVAPSGRWKVAPAPQPMKWRGGVAPPPPSAPGLAGGRRTGSSEPERGRPDQVGGRRR
ncbi:MAG: hypothetical protein ACYDHB_02455 [Candidatus Dormibacteria bacterium]